MTSHDLSIEDLLLERPVPFRVGRRRFRLYAPTLGSLVLTGRVESLLPDLSSLPAADAALALARDHRDGLCRLLAMQTLRGSRRLFDEGLIARRARLLATLDDDSLAQLRLMSQTAWPSVREVTDWVGLSAESHLRQRVASVKHSRGTVSFGGRSVYGTLVDSVCQRYGWSLQYVLWGISYANLRLLMADAVTTVHLSDEERRAARLGDGDAFVNADDPAQLAAFVRSQSWD